MNNNNGQGPLAGIIRGVGDSLSGAVNTLSQGGSIRDVVSSVNQQSISKLLGKYFGPIYMYRVVQLNFTPEIEVLYMPSERSLSIFSLTRSLSIFSLTSLKQHMEYFYFLCYIQLDFPVCVNRP